MARKTLEDKVKDAHNDFGKEYCPKIEEMGYYLMYGISKVGIRDQKAPKKDKNKLCLVAYITKHEENPIIEPETIMKIARNIIPDEYKGFKVFLEYRKPLKARNGSRPILPSDPVHPYDGEPSGRILGYRDLHPLKINDEDLDEEEWEKRND